jgi:hypothetical protein
MKLMVVPDIELNVPVSSMECRDLVMKKKYTTLDGKTHKIALQEENIIKSQDLGLIHDEDDKVSCEGQGIRIQDHLINDAVQVSQIKIVIQKEAYSTDAKGRVEVLGDHLRLPKTCKSVRGSCQTAGKTYFWTPPDSKCPLEKVRNVRMRPSGKYMVDDDNKVLLKILGQVPAPSKCPTTTIMTTEYPDLYLATEGNFPNLGNEVQIDTFVAALADYTMFHTEQEIQKAAIEAKEKLCQQKYQLEDGDIHRVDKDHFASRKGDVAYLFQCKQKTGTVKTMETCYKDIPIEPNGFVNALTKVFTEKSAPVRCNPNFPLEIHTNEGWITLSPSPKQVQTPEKLPITHYLINHKDLVGGGIYTQDELKNWRDHLEDGTFQDAIMGTLTYGVCVNSGDCEGADGSSANYDLSRLNPLLKGLQQLDMWTQLDNFLKEYATYLAVVVILIETFRLFSMVILFITTLMREGLSGLLAIMFMTCCGEIHKYQKIRRRRKRHRDQEEMELQDVPDGNVSEGDM